MSRKTLLHGMGARAPLTQIENSLPEAIFVSSKVEGVTFAYSA